MSMLPTTPACELATCPVGRHWLIEGLWSRQAVGIVGGEPKCWKSFLALDMAVSVSSGKPCLGRFAALDTGRVLLHAAEDAQHIVRQRLEGLARSRAVALDDLDIQVVTAPSVRLDITADRNNLSETVAALRPKLLILDPFVRMHRCDENLSVEVAPLLAFLRELQRAFAVSVVLVHHAKKGAGRIRAGQALRGSSELHAWGDDNLYLRRLSDDVVTLTTEHRAAPPEGPFDLALETADGGFSLRVQTAKERAEQPAPLDPQQRVLDALRSADEPLTMAALRATCRMRTQLVCTILGSLRAAGRIHKTDAGYRLAS